MFVGSASANGIQKKIQHATMDPEAPALTGTVNPSTSAGAAPLETGGGFVSAARMIKHPGPKSRVTLSFEAVRARACP